MISITFQKNSFNINMFSKQEELCGEGCISLPDNRKKGILKGLSLQYFNWFLSILIDRHVTQIGLNDFKLGYKPAEISP